MQLVQKKASLKIPVICLIRRVNEFTATLSQHDNPSSANSCIDQSTSSEFSEALNCVFHWYRAAAKCYVHLSDVSTGDQDVDTSQHHESAWGTAFRTSRWFTRSWTLPELLAPCSLEFFSREGKRLGDKKSFERQISEITHIPTSVLCGAPLGDFGVEECISWMKHREATREEDRAYALLGIFGVHKPIIYGEGEYNAFVRLRKEIARKAKDSARDRSLGARDALLYTPLDHSEFRILVLHPGFQNDDISVDLEKDNLSSPRPFQALSYVWGPEPALHPIFATGNKQISIKPNLFQALQRIRRPRSTLRLWIDSICIDQSNTSERNLQVQRMGEIFRKAQDVWIWLGEEYSNSDTAMDLVSAISFSRFSWKKTQWNIHGMLAFNDLLGRPWFQRGWVVQEAAFSTNSIVVCGDRQINWRDLTISIRLVQMRLEFESSHDGSTELVSRLRRLLGNFQDSPATRLLEVVDSVFKKRDDGSLVKTMRLERLVELGTSLDTTDPRDSIYALLNLANDTSPKIPQTTPGIIVPDYDKGMLEVFADFVLHCCRTSASLDIICRPWAPSETYLSRQNYQSGGRYKSRIPSLSWIKSRDQLPFGNPSQNATYRLHGTSLVENSQIQKYRAHNGTKPIIDITRFSDGIDEYPSLRARGIVVGEVDQCSMRMASAIIPSSCIDIIGEHSEKLNTTVRPPPETLMRILCAGRFNPKSLDTLNTPELHGLWFSKQFPTSIREFSDLDIEELLEENQSPAVKDYLEIVRDTVWNRRTFRGRRVGRPADPLIGLVPRDTKVGDTLCILYGCSVPVVLRNVGGLGKEDSHWHLIGEAYVHGLMHGEAISSLSPTVLKAAELDFDIR
ncbi:HET-domain-containing protein [Amniculicola lignicola CBS 123094]|uniref:HET-domain-containing protein n=1 Tax=Amniculicola lignicola CBS 123094 TaxID=1392246 RepID=A0A6A5WYG0_9PLEO|nr:HET-domain-containing protein [Amniculicola lignicola CBS 123094]